MEKDKLDAIKSWLGFGSQLVGAGAGGIAGGLLAGPGGAALIGMGGVAVAEAFNRVGGEVLERVLGNREKERVGALYYFAISKISERLERGESIREDEYFRSTKKTRDAASELLEAAILAAQREHEELKIKYLSNLVAYITFDPTFDRAKANYFIKIATNLSYRQFCLLGVYLNKERMETIIRPKGKPFIEMPSPNRDVGIIKIDAEYRLPLDKWMHDLPQEIKELERLDLIHNEKMVSTDKLRDAVISPLGTLFCTALSLEDLDGEDLIAIARQFL